MESKEGIDALFQFATEGILIVDDSGSITRINPSAEKLFGYGSGDLIGQKIEVLIPRKSAAKHQEYRQNYSGNPHARSMGSGMDLKGLKKDGSEFPVEISLSPYTSGGRKFVIAFIVDITVRKQAEEKLKNYSSELEQQVRNRTLILEEAIQELEHTKRDLHNALEKEKDLSELKSRFVSMASHEFRTPLTTMMSSLSLIQKYRERHDEESQAKHEAKIKSSINNLTDILNDFLSVSKLEEGKMFNQPEPLNLKEFVTDLCAEMQAMVESGQQLACDYFGNEEVNLDKKLLRHVLINLISNAIKFSPAGGNIAVSTKVKGNRLELSVSDSGIGIPEKDQKHLFERFFRGNNATHIQGTGLGLNIVYKYVELMNGMIGFRSQENEGTTFNITIDL